jgi:DNA-binding response OmpR family regulator
MSALSRRLDLRRAKILIVDDNAHSLDILSQILLGFRVRETKSCRSGAEARELIGAQIFDLIIMDAEMPDEDGITVTRHIRSQSKIPNFTTPVILVTAHTSVDKVVKARDAGANLVVRKPIAPAILLSRINWLARNSRDFVSSDDYRGPDRRFKNKPLPEGVDERRADALALTASLDRKMSQDDIDALFD